MFRRSGAVIGEASENRGDVMFVNISRSLFRCCNHTLAILVVVMLLLTTGCTKPTSEAEAVRSGPGPVTQVAIPHSLVAEHEELHRMLKETVDLGGETGKFAKLVDERLAPHFVKEEEYALPPLTLLPDLAQDKALTDASEMIRRSERMKAELPQMLNEHKSIVLALDQLTQAARNESKESALQFVEKLRLHARMEEEILYPAAIVAGEYAKLRAGSKAVSRVDTPFEINYSMP